MTEPRDARRKSSSAELSGGDPMLGAIIRKARVAAGLRQDQLAELVGVSSKAAVSNWEKGINKITDDNRRKLSVALKIPLHVMFRTGESPNPRQDDIRLELSAEERDMVAKFRRLRPDRREAVLLILSSYDDSNEPLG